MGGKQEASRKQYSKTLFCLKTIFAVNYKLRFTCDLQNYGMVMIT